MSKLEQVLSKIRDINNLKRLEFGCEVESGGTRYYYHSTDMNGNWNLYGLYPDYIHARAQGKIIGLPIELNHLLYSIDKVKGNCGFGTMATNGWFHYHTKRASYDMQKSVTQNLQDNPELLNLVAELLDIKE